MDSVASRIVCCVALTVGLAGATSVRSDDVALNLDPSKALSDGPNAWPLDRMRSLLATLQELDQAVKKKPFEESLL